MASLLDLARLAGHGSLEFPGAVLLFSVLVYLLGVALVHHGVPTRR